MATFWEFNRGRCHGPHLKPLSRWAAGSRRRDYGMPQSCSFFTHSKWVHCRYVRRYTYTFVCKLEVIVEEGRTHFAENALKLWSKDVWSPVNGSSQVMRAHPGRENLVLNTFLGEKKKNQSPQIKCPPLFFLLHCLSVMSVPGTTVWPPEHR